MIGRRDCFGCERVGLVVWRGFGRISSLLCFGKGKGEVGLVGLGGEKGFLGGLLEGRWIS